nr:RRP12-like protein [Onthophagus taurus]
MGKFRTKLKGQTKGKRWPKGHSSSSNPETKKHRDQAKGRFFQPNIGSSTLTLEALRRHDAVQTWTTKPENVKSEEMDEGSVSSYSSYQTIQSFASEWSDCSNMSYNRFLKVFRSDSALHKEMLAILAAIAEVIKQNGGTETSTEYYCSLWTTLETILESDDKNDMQVAATLALIDMGVRQVPVAVLRKNFEDISDALLQILNDYIRQDNNIIIKSTIGIVCALLRSLDYLSWNQEKPQKLFDTLINPFSIHSKPKWRKSAQKAISLVLMSDCFQNEKINYPAEKLAEFCEETLNGCLGGTSSVVLVSSLQSSETTILHSLGLLKETISHFSKTHIKKCSEIILRLFNLHNHLITSCGLQVFHSLFSTQKAVVPAKLNAQIITALYDYKPPLTDVQPNLAWLVVMKQAHIHLADVNLNLCIEILPKLFSTVTQLWLSEKPEILTAVTHNLEALLQDAVAPMMDNEGLLKEQQPKIAKCFETIENCLGYQYHTAWHQVLHVIGIMFEVAGKNCSDLLLSCLKSLSELRDSYKFSYNSELEHAIGAAIRSMGPEIVLNVISLKRENDELNLDRSWILPVLKENIKQSTLNFWINGILPLAIYCNRRSMMLAEKNDGIGSHSSELLYLQLWNLLPSFCNAPTDIKTNFKNIAKVLGTAISERKELRLSVMACLRKLISFAKENEDKGDLNELSRFDKNYLPILFNVYTTKPIGTDEEGQRLAALDTIKVYLSISKPELKHQLFKNALEKMESSNDQPDQSFLNESIMDLIRALIPYQSVEEITNLYENYIKKLPEIKNNREQKKLYRILEEICGCESEGCKEFLKSNRKTVQSLLKKSLDSAAVSSKAARLRCFSYLIQSQPQLDHESGLIKTVVPEAILCCKDINEKCRATAYDLLRTIGLILQNHDQLQEFINMLIAGLAGTTEMISCTILALTSALHNFSGALGKDNIQNILENISILMTSKTREIVASCLSFIKVYTSTLPSTVVGASLGEIVKALCSMTEDCKRHFRLKLRDIFDKFVRKYGCDAITPFVPETDTIIYKRLRNLRKLNARKKRMKDEAKRKDTEESDEDEEFLIKSKPKTVEEILADSDSDLDEIETKSKQKSLKKKPKPTWISEDVDDIIDFKDPSTTSKITAAKPIQNDKQIVQEEKKKDRGFKTSSDGRLLITDDGDSKNEKKTFGFSSDSDEDSDDDKRKTEAILIGGRKRKRSEAGSVKSGVSSMSQISKYKPGGSGIHREVKAINNPGSEYKAKKARGDIKKKSKVDPYAYLPLMRSALNKRKKMKNAGKFKNIIGGAKSGVKKGLKAKKRSK